MAAKKGRRRFGSVRALPSGRFQARYRGTDGVLRSAPHPFATERDAENWLTIAESEVLRGDWTDPRLGQELLRDFGRRWMDHHKVGRRTREEYDSLWRLHLEPFLGDRQLSHITTETVRQWRTRLLQDGRSEDRAAKAYSLLRAMMNTAVDDELIKRNPCRVKGAGQHRTPERPVATVPQVFALADAMPARFRVLVLSATFTGLRWGELIALRRRDVQLDARVLVVRRRLAESRGGVMGEGPPKSVAGVRTVSLPDVLVPELRQHIDSYAEPGPDGLLFTGERGGPLRRGNFHRATKWTKTVVEVGLPAGFDFHDLRHTGNQLAAAAGASTRELMHRMGHGSMRAALIYQHATNQRDRVLADGLSDLVHTARGTSSGTPSEPPTESPEPAEEDR
jgi:integrase